MMSGEAPRKSPYESGQYWKKRRDFIYYQYLELMVRCLAPEAKSLIDVGSGNSPYLEWFDWIERKVSADIVAPYSSDSVEGIVGNILDLEFDGKFDICTCLQVLEHIDEPAAFARKLLTLSDLVLISVPYKWPRVGKSARFHPQDPVDLAKVEEWFGRRANYTQVVQEPFLKAKGRRMFAIFDADEARTFGTEVYKNRMRRSSSFI